MKKLLLLMSVMLLSSASVFAYNGQEAVDPFEETELSEIELSHIDGEIDDDDGIKGEVTSAKVPATENISWNFELVNITNTTITFYLHNFNQMLDVALAHSSRATTEAVPALYKAVLKPGQTLRLAGLKSELDLKTPTRYLISIYHPQREFSYYKLSIPTPMATAYAIYEKGKVLMLPRSFEKTESGLPLNRNRSRIERFQ